MNQKKRQHVLIAGAGLCLLIVMSQLFGGGGRQNTEQAAALPAETPMTNTPEEPVSFDSTSPTRSGFYRTVRQKLKDFIPEQNDPFFVQPGIAAPKSEMGTLLHSNPGPLPPLPVASEFEIQNPTFVRQNVSTGKRENEKARGREEGVEEAKMFNQTTPQPQTPNPKLKGFVRQAETGMAIALIEWENRLLQVSTEPGSEWQIVSYNEESIIMKRGEERWELKREQKD